MTKTKIIRTETVTIDKPFSNLKPGDEVRVSGRDLDLQQRLRVLRRHFDSRKGFVVLSIVACSETEAVPVPTTVGQLAELTLVADEVTIIYYRPPVDAQRG